MLTRTGCAREDGEIQSLRKEEKGPNSEVGVLENKYG